MTENYSIPRNDDAEKCLLSCLVQWQDLIDQIACHPDPADLFYTPRHKVTFEQLAHLRAAYPQGFDLTILTSTLTDSGKLEAAGGGTFLADLLTSADTHILFDHYLEICDEKRKRRSLLNAIKTTQSALSSPDASSGVVTAELIQKLNQIDSGAKEGTLAKLSEGLRELVDEIQDRWEGKADPVGLSTGFPIIDHRTGGLKGGQHVVIGARPGAGKTSMGLNIAQHVAMCGKNVMIFSAEMTRKELQIRAISEHSGIDSRVLSNNVRPDQLKKEFHGKLFSALSKVKELPIWVDDKSNLRVSEIESKSRRMHREMGIDLIVVDYLQLLKPEGDAWSKEDAVARMSGGLKNLAKELTVPVLTMVQLNRNSETGNRRPGTSDFRDSGSIEQDADMALLLYRNDPEDQDPVVDVTYIVAKCRGGQTGDVDLSFNRPTTTFKEAQQ